MNKELFSTVTRVPRAPKGSYCLIFLNCIQSYVIYIIVTVVLGSFQFFFLSVFKECRPKRLQKNKFQSFRHIDSMGAFASLLGDCTFSLVYNFELQNNGIFEFSHLPAQEVL